MITSKYYAITHNSLWDLGVHETLKNADKYAIDQFNLHNAPSGYLVLNYKELEIIKSLLDKKAINILQKRLSIGNLMGFYDHD